MLKDKSVKVITNNGKFVAKRFLQEGFNRCEIIDVILNEKIISNGNVDFKSIDLEYIFEKYGLSKDVYNNLSVSQLYQVWTHQEKLIRDMSIENVFELEKKILWISADIELTGIGIDVVGMIEYQESIQKQIIETEIEIYKVIPEKISLTNNDKLRAYVNRTFRLDLKGINKGSFKYHQGYSSKKNYSIDFKASTVGKGKYGY